VNQVAFGTKKTAGFQEFFKYLIPDSTLFYPDAIKGYGGKRYSSWILQQCHDGSGINGQSAAFVKFFRKCGVNINRDNTAFRTETGNVDCLHPGSTADIKDFQS
jgi:hypothetical protein